jgi:rare lipoprotein A
MEIKYKCLIVDDEKPAHRVIKSHMEQCPELVYGGSAYNGKDALQMANRLRRVMGNTEPLVSIAKISQPSFNQIDNYAPDGRRVRGGVASWYGPGFHGRRTANGERYNQNDYTAAHKTLPFGTMLRVTNLRNGQSVMVRINDRGPYVGRRVIDLSAGAARAIGVYGSGTAVVQLEVLN